MPKKDTKQSDQKTDSTFIQLENDAQDAASAASAFRRRVLAAVLSAVCVVLIVVSLGFVFPTESGAWSLAWVPRVLSGESAVAPSTAAVPTVSRKSHHAEAAKSSDGSKEDAEKSDKNDYQSDDASDDQQGSSDNGGSSSENSGKGKDAAATNKKESSQQHQSSNQGGSSQGGGNNSQTNNGGATTGTSSSQESNQVTVSVTVTSSAVGSPVSASGSFTFNKGATVYDALCALGLSVNAHGSSYGTYVAAIGGLAEKEHGGKSGWMYSVNGSTPMVACSGYKLSNGDKVVWYYVTGD